MNAISSRKFQFMQKNVKIRPLYVKPGKLTVKIFSIKILEDFLLNFVFHWGISHFLQTFTMVYTFYKFSWQFIQSVAFFYFTFLKFYPPLSQTIHR